MEHFDKVIGYDEIKKELGIYLDMMKNPEKYSKFGVRLPRGILFEGLPGLGKSLMAECFIKTSGWNCYICRKHNDDGAFLEEITNIFHTAAENEPAIVFLDDMDKFSNEDADKSDTNEYVTIQTGMDNVKDKRVLVIATVNNRFKLPQSLTRAGRIEKSIEFRIPNVADTEKIVKYYLRQKNTVEDMDVREIVSLLRGRTCADLEAVLNDAALYAGYQNKEKVTMEDIIKAFLRRQHKEPDGYIDEDNLYVKQIAYHEAGHVLVAESLGQEKVMLVSLYGNEENVSGLTAFRGNEWADYSEEMLRNRIKIKLAGKAATEMVFGIADTGAVSDCSSAYRIANELVCHYGAYGFEYFSALGRGNSSDEFYRKRERFICAELERNYGDAKKILAQKREVLDRLAQRLLQKKTLGRKDIVEIVYGE